MSNPQKSPTSITCIKCKQQKATILLKNSRNCRDCFLVNLRLKMMKLVRTESMFVCFSNLLLKQTLETFHANSYTKFDLVLHRTQEFQLEKLVEIVPQGYTLVTDLTQTQLAMHAMTLITLGQSSRMSSVKDTFEFRGVKVVQPLCRVSEKEVLLWHYFHNLSYTPTRIILGNTPTDAKVSALVSGFIGGLEADLPNTCSTIYSTCQKSTVYADEVCECGFPLVRDALLEMTLKDSSKCRACLLEAREE